MKKLLPILLLVSLSTFGVSAQSFDCPDDAIGGIPLVEIYHASPSFASSNNVKAQSFVNFDSLSFGAISLIGIRTDDNLEKCTDQIPPTFKLDFWTWESNKPGQLLESPEIYVTSDSVGTWDWQNETWTLEQFTFSFNEPKSYSLGFFSVYVMDESPNSKCRFYWVNPKEDGINLPGAAINDDSTTATYFDFNFCLLPMALSPAAELQFEPNLKLFPNPSTGDEVTLEVHLPQAASISLQLYDATGRRVRTFFEAEKMGEGESVRHLNLEALPPGVYHLLLASPSGRKAVKLVRM